MEMQMDAPHTGKVLYRRRKKNDWVAEMPCKTRVTLKQTSARILGDGGGLREPAPNEKLPIPMGQDTVAIYDTELIEGEITAKVWAIRSRSVEM